MVHRVCSLPLIGWWWPNRVVFQVTQSSAFTFQAIWGPHACAQLEATISTWVGALVHIEELRDMYQIVMHIPWGGTRTKPQPALFISALPHLQLISSCLNLPCGTQGWSRRLNPFFYKKEMGNTERLLYLGGPNTVLLGSNPPFSLILFTLEGNSCWTRKGIRLLIERLIINLAEDFRFIGTHVLVHR